VLGASADLFGKMRLMMASLFILVLAGLAGAVASDFSLLLTARVVAGIASGGIFPIGLAVVGDLVPVNERQVAISRVLAATMTGNLLGASMAGVIGDAVGWRGVFVATGAIGTIVFVAALAGLRRVKIRETARFDLSNVVPSFRAIFRNPLAKVCFGSVFLEGLFLFGLFPYMAVLLHTQGERRATIAGLVIAAFGIGGVFYTFTVALLLRQVGERGLMLGGGAMMALGLVIVASDAPWPFQAANFMAIGCGFYMLHGVIQIYVTELAPRARALSLSLHSASFFLGQGLGPLVYGLGFARVGTAPSLIFGALVLILVALFCARRLRREEEETG
jgi:predicted MFS family arabinose efflux permease